MSTRDIVSLDCELTVYRKGYLSVHIDLARGYLTWRESNTWTNNFTRSLRQEQIEQIRTRLAQSGWLLELPMAGDESDSTDTLICEDVRQPGSNGVTWSLCLKTSGCCLKGTGRDTLPDGWPELRQTIETFSRLPFSLH